jgi:hypothetical protein
MPVANAEMPDQCGEPAMLRRLCADGRFLLPCPPNDVEGYLLSQRASAQRTKQEPMQFDRAHSDQDQSAMLFGGPDTGAKRRVLPGRKRNVEGRLLPGGDHDAGPLELPGANSSHHQTLRVRLHEDAGRELLQQSLPERGRQDLQHQADALCAGTVPRSQWSLRTAPGNALSAGPGAQSRR